MTTKKEKLKKIFNIYMPIIYILILLIYIFIGNILVTYQKIDLINLSVGIAALGLLGLCIYIFNKLLNKKKFDFYDFIILVLIVLGIISTLFSINKSCAIFGFYDRYEGFLQLFSYYILFLNCKNLNNKKYKKIIINMILIICLVNSIYAILQFYNVGSILGIKIIKYTYYSEGFVLNSNFLGSLMTIFLSLVITLFLFDKTAKFNVIYFALTLFSFIGLLTTGAMSSVVSVFFLIIFLIILFIVLKYDIKKNIIKVISIVYICTIIFLIFNFKDNSYLISQTKKTVNEIKEISKGKIKDNFGTGRIHIWKETLKILPNNLITGVGIDNFYFAFGENKLIDMKSGLVVDKAHNEYLQKLVTEGILSFITYLVLLGTIFIKSCIKIFKENISINYIFLGLFMSFVSYSIQAFFNISVISVAPIYYIVMGILVSELKEV